MGIHQEPENGRLCEEAQDKSEIGVLCERYTSVFTKYDGRVPVPTVPYHLPSMHHVTIDANGVQKLLTEETINKANGPDIIQNTVLKENNREFAPILKIYSDNLLGMDGSPKTGSPRMWSGYTRKALSKKLYITDPSPSQVSRARFSNTSYYLK